MNTILSLIWLVHRTHPLCVIYYILQSNKIAVNKRREPKKKLRLTSLVIRTLLMLQVIISFLLTQQKILKKVLASHIFAHIHGLLLVHREEHFAQHGLANVILLNIRVKEMQYLALLAEFFHIVTKMTMLFSR